MAGGGLYEKIKNMKKISTLSLSVLLVFLTAAWHSLSAQTVLFHEGFEGGVLPAGWTEEHSGDYQGWICEIIDQDSIISNGVMTDENIYWLYSSYTPDNWLISPSISLPASSKLSFRVRGGVTNSENISVYVATSHLVEDMLNGTPVWTGKAYFNTWSEVTINLSPYAGETVYIGFRHHNIVSKYNFQLYLDDVEVVQINDTLLTVSIDSCDFGVVGVGHSSVPKKVSYSAYNISESIAVQTVSPFEVSLDKTYFTHEISLDGAEGCFYIRYLPVDTGFAPAFVTVSASDVDDILIHVNGEGTPCEEVISQLPYSVDFNTDPPLCWDLIAANDVTWHSNYILNGCGWASCLGSNDDKIEQYETPVFDFSQHQNMVMTFDFQSNDYYVNNNYVDFKIYASTDGGITYDQTPIWKLSDYGSFDSWTTSSATVNLRKLEGQSNVRFKFSYEGKVCQVLFGNLRIKEIFLSPERIVYVKKDAVGNQDGSSWGNAMVDLQEAISYVSVLDSVTIWVAAGAYYGDTTSSTAFKIETGINVFGGFAGDEPIGYDLSLRDFENNTTILDGQQSRQVLSISASSTTFDGFTVQNGYSSRGGGVSLGKGVTISNCNINNNSASYRGGGLFCDRAHVLNCKIVNNNSSSYGGGCWVNRTDLRNCIITHNTAYTGGGLYSGELYSDVKNETTVCNCLISNNSTANNGGGLYCYGLISIQNSTIARNSSSSQGAGIYNSSDGSSYRVMMTNSIVWGNIREDSLDNIYGTVYGFCCAMDEERDDYHHVVINNLDNSFSCFVNPSNTAGADDATPNTDWHLTEWSPCINRGNNAFVDNTIDLDGMPRIQLDTVDLGCYETGWTNHEPNPFKGIVYVTSTGGGTNTGESWENAMSSIQEAVMLAKSRAGIVWVAAGTYYGDTTSTNAFTMADGVNVYGGFSGNESADFDLSQRDFEAHESILDGQNARRVLYQPYHFNVETEWNGFTIRNGYAYENGAGAFLKQRGLLSQCNVQNNVSSSYNGGGVYAELAKVTGCLIKNNAANYGSGGGLFADGANVSDCRIVNNTANNGAGGGLYATDNALIFDCLILNNSSREVGGVFAAGGTRIVNCNITNNVSTGYQYVSGMGYVYSGGVKATNTTVFNCLISNNNGVGLFLSNSNVTNSTIVRNATGVASPDDGIVKNSIIWGNGTNLIGKVSCSYSAIEGGSAGENNIVMNNWVQPLFVNPAQSIGASDTAENADWHLLYGSPCINHGSNAFVTEDLDLDGVERVRRDTVDLGCYESDCYSVPLPEYENIVYVTPAGSGDYSGNSWANAIPSINEATILAKTYGCEVWVAAGTYYGDTTAQYAFTMRDGVNVYGGFAGNEPVGYDLSLRNFETNKTILDGQNFRGVLYSNSCSNRTVWDGFSIENGSNYYNAISLYENTELSRCRVSNNGGGQQFSNSIVSKCVFSNNNNYYMTLNDAQVLNCLISNNTTSNYMINGYGQIVNSTIVRNTSNYKSLAAPNNKSLSFMNCIVWGNQYGNWYSSFNEDSLHYSHSVLENMFIDTDTNIFNSRSEDLIGFVNPSLQAGVGDSTDNVDWHLQSGSVCVNRGDNSFVSDMSKDIEGHPRIKHDTVDLGCYESDLYSSEFPEYGNIVYVTEEGSGNKCGNCWANATSSIADAQEIASLLNADVWVAEGVYYGDTSAENAFTMVEGVNVYGGFAGNESVDYDLSQRNFEIHETILDGDSSRRVLNQVILNYAETNVETRWDGFTIRNGSASYGGGANLERNSVLSHCKVINNQAAEEGGGIYCSQSIVSECTISGNASTGVWAGGGGIYADGSLIHNCVISDNYSYRYGGGARIDTSMVMDCTIRSNTAERGGGGVAAYSGSEVRNCAILENSTTSSGNSNYGGGGVFSMDSYIIDCEVRNNNSAYDGGGIYSINSQIDFCTIWGNNAAINGGGVDASSSDVSRCTISRNTSKNGGGVYMGETSNVTNCLISNNEVNHNPYSYGINGHGSGVYGNNGCSISSSTIVNNLSDYYGAGVNGGVSLLNCIVWGNKNNNTTGSNLNGVSSVRYCAIENGYTGTGNIVLNEVNPPMFLNPSIVSGASDSTEFEDWRLHVGSPCINVGNNMDVTESLDLDGSARIKCDTVDLGCYESNYNSGVISEYDSIVYVTVSGAGDRSGNSWENAKSSINEAQALAQVFNAVVWVAAGTYYGDTTAMNAFTMRDGVSVYGGFAGNEPANFDLSSRDFVANATILDGKNVRRVLYQQNASAKKTIWDGFTIQNGYVVNGSGGGVFLRGNVALEHCIVTKNYSNFSGGGVMANGGSHFTISNCLISCNTARYTGGVVIDDGVVENSTIVRNMSTYSSAGVKAGNTYSSPILTNSIVWGNQSSDGSPSNLSGTFTCTHSAVEGGCEGDSIITLSAENPPLFVNPSLTAGADDSTANVDWHLQQGSPCINRGDNSAVTDSLDLDGTARIKRDTVDMGCYESDYYNSIFIDTVLCHIVLEIGRQNPDWNADYTTPWIEVYQGDDEYPSYAYYYMTGTAGTNTEIIPVISGVPLRLVWHEVDTIYRNSWCTVYSPSGEVVFEKQRFQYLENGTVLNYTSHCDNVDAGGHVYVTTTGTGSGSSWNDALSSIKTANIIALNSGADVWVAAGTYYGDTRPTSENAFMMMEDVNVYGGFAGNEPADFDLSQRNIGANKTVLDGQGVRQVLNSRNFTKTTLWDGFTIQHGRSYSGSGVALFSNAQINHCAVLNNYSTGGGGGVYADHGFVSNCLIANNTASWGSGLVAWYSPVINATIVHNSGASGVSCDNATLGNTIVWGNQSSDGSPSNLSGTFTCTHSAVEGGCEGDSIVTLSVENPPLFVNPSLTAGAGDSTTNVDWHLQQGSPCINAGDNSVVTDSLDLDGTPRVQDGRVDMGCYEYALDSVPVAEYDSIIYVTVTGAGTHSGNSWANATSSIDTAQALAQLHNAVVWVAAGIYYGDTTSANAFTMHNGVSVYGGFAGNEPADYNLSLRDFEMNATVLEGQNVRRVLYQPSAFGEEAVWDGFTITHGQITGNGAGAYLQDNGKLSHCVVENNAGRGGGGIYCKNTTVSSCVVRNNSSTGSGDAVSNGGGIYASNSVIDSCQVSHNTQSNNHWNNVGGGVCITASSVLRNSIVSYNSSTGDAGGVYILFSGSICNCQITNNTSSVYGGGVYANAQNSSNVISNSLIANNTSSNSGGGICMWYSNASVHVINSTIVNNAGGAGIYSSNSTAYLRNCLVWGNGSSLSGSVNCMYSAIQGGYSGEGNVNLSSQNTGDGTHPFFVNPTQGRGTSYSGGDWHLLEQSACINAGSLDSTLLTETDLDGNPRVHQERVDMGCYEWQYDVIDSVVSIIVIPNDAALGTVTGSGTYTIGDTVTLHAIPNQHVRFLRWSDNDTANPRVVIAETDTTFTAIFEYYLPELHVTSISHSDFVGGEPVTISWTVQNDGTAPTPNGEVWYDRVWLSVESRVAAGDNNPILLGVFPNVSALAPGEYYTQTQSFDIPLSIAGSYYLFVITDANDATVIYWDSVVQNPYNPPPYIRAYSHHCSGAECGNYAGNRILEITEVDDYPYYHDNFFYELVNIAIPPLPDLKIPALSSNIQNFYSGSQVNLTFQILNDGNYDTRVQQWKDVVFISYHSEFDETARVLKTISHQGLLLPDSSYQVSTTVTVPLEMHGTAYFYAYTDYYDQVYEHVGRYNNVTRSDSVNVILTPPADLIPQNITADNTVSTGASFHFSYEIHNQGAGAPNYSTWLDRCYLSTSADSLVDAIQVANDWHYSGLPVGDSYTVSHTVALPTSITEGTYYLFIQADANNNVFEFTFENNNLLRYAQPITVLQPDLQITTLNVQDTLHAGAEEAISYRIANTGNGAVINQTVKDRVYLSQYFDGSSATQIAELSHNCWLNAQDSLLKMQNVTLPSNLQEGVYYLFVRTNATNTLREANIDNNRSPIKQVYIHYQPLPDLIITNVTMPDVVVAGDTAVLGVYLKNNGEIAANISNLTWKMVDTVGNQEVECTIRPDNAGVATLAAGDSIYLVKYAFIPPALSGNPVSLTLVVNPNHALTESNYSNNKYAIIHVVQPYPFDLSVNQLNAPAGVVSGEYINVTWRVKNEGSVPVSSHSGSGSGSRETVDQSVQWYDRVYLSQDSIFDNTDVEIGHHDRRTVVYAGRQYNVNKSFQIPVYADGNYYILVVSDADSATFDCQRTNNVRGKPIAVTQSALPDLQMDTLLAPNTLTTGASYQIPFTVSNEGDHITHGDRWTDALYLNDEPTTEGAELLGSRIHNGQLDVNGQYADSIAVTIPNTWIGDGYLIGYTDATDQIFEKNSDSNNLFILPVSVARPLPCDLTVLSPDFPQSANVGENVQISWSLLNIGLNIAQGNIKDAVYLSIDSTWSSDDIMLGSLQYDVNLAANSQEQRTDTFLLQGVPAGDYYVVVRTNILNALNENSYTNNKAVSLMTMHVDYPSLYIDQEEQVQLNSGQSVYYKLEVGPEYEHQTLSCKLTASSPNVSNGLYIAYSSAPSASNFDWSATMPYVQEQEILIPSLNQGTYYIMATGQMANNAVQPVTLLATIVDFEIISVTANSGANTGSVTTQIIGAKFDTVMDFRLANSNGYLPAEKVFFHNSTETYATFNLRDQETGVYDMVAELPGGIITVKGQAFVVEHGLPAELLSNIIAPASVRNGNTFTVTIEYGNNGSTDLNISGFLLVSTNGFPIAFSSDSLANNATELTFETGEPNGNPDVIRPGHFATKTIFVKATHVGNINLKLYPIRRQY